MITPFGGTGIIRRQTAKIKPQAVADATAVVHPVVLPRCGAPAAVMHLVALLRGLPKLPLRLRSLPRRRGESTDTRRRTGTQSTVYRGDGVREHGLRGHSVRGHEICHQKRPQDTPVAAGAVSGKTCDSRKFPETGGGNRKLVARRRR